MSYRIFIHLALATLCLAAATAPEPKRRLKILVNSPTLGWSHNQFQGRIADVLAEAGHEVHVLIFELSPFFGNYTGVTRGQRVMRVARSPDKRDAMLKLGVFSKTYGGTHNMLLDGFLSDFNHFMAGVCEEMLTMDALIDQLRAERYDVALSELYDYCFIGIAHAIGVPTTLGSYAVPLNSMAGELFGIPTFSSYVTNIFAPSISAPADMSFWERASNFFADTYVHFFAKQQIFNLLQPLFARKYGADFPTIRRLARGVSLLFVNSREFFELPKPVSNKIVYIGGIVQSQVKELTKEFAALMERPSSSGVVLFSLGTVAEVTKMSPAMMRAFIGAFARFPSYEFIWKFAGHANYSALFANAPNVHPHEWVDQRALLAHPKLRAFITHCGMNSLSEGAQAGVPMVGIPLFGDQLFNSALMNHKRVGVYLDIRQLEDERPIVEALQRVLGDESYATRAKTLSRKLQLSPFPPAERLVKWVEFAAEFPELNELNLPTEEDMHWLVYYSLDVIGASLVALTLLGYVTYAALKRALAWQLTVAECPVAKKKA